MPTFTRRNMLALGGAAMAAQPTLLRGAEIEDLEFQFLQVSDTHVSTERLLDTRQAYDVPSEDSIFRTREVVKAINECTMPHELVVHTGDQAHTRAYDDDYDLAHDLLKFDKPAYHVPGNHDLGYSETPKYLPRWEERFGKANQAFEPVDGLRFVMFNSQPLDTRAPREHRDEAMKILDGLLTPAQPTILFCHCMGMASFHVNQLWDGWPDIIMKPWISRMKEGGVMAVLAGHFHRSELYMVDGLPFHISGPVINFWGRQTCFHHWALANGQLTKRTIYLEL